MDLSSSAVGIINRSGNQDSGEKKTTLPARIADWVLQACFVMIFFGLPIFFTGFTFQGIAFDKTVYFYFWMLLALVSWAVKGVIEGEMKIRRTPLDIPMIAFWLAYLLATIFSIDKWHSFWGVFGDPSRGLVNITALVILYYLIVSTFTLRKLLWMTGAIVTSGIFVSIWSILAIFGIKFLPDVLNRFAPVSLVGSFVGLGMFFSIVIPIIITVIFQIKGSDKLSERLKSILISVLILFVLLILFLIFVIFGFVPWIGLLIGVGFFLIYILSQIIRPAGSFAWVPMVAFVMILMFLMIGGTKIGKVNFPVEVSPAYKLSLEVAKDSIKDSFLLGSGPGTYSHAFSLHRPEDFNKNPLFGLRFSQGSGVVFEAVSTIGALGTIALIMLLLTFISVSLYLLSTGKEHNKIYSLGFTTAAIIMIINGVSLSTAGPMLIYGAMIGMLSMAVLLYESRIEENYLNLSLKASPKFALAFAFLFMVISAGVVYLFVSIGKIVMADAYAGLAVRETEVNEKSLSRLANAIVLYSKEPRYYIQLGQEYMVLANTETQKGEKERNVEAITNYLNNAIFSVKKAQEMVPKDIIAAEALAQIYENSGLYVSDSLGFAEDAYKKALELEPNNPNYFVKLGQIKLALALSKKEEMEKKELVGEARDLFQQAIDKKDDFAPGLYNLALAKEALADLDGAVGAAEKAFDINRRSGSKDLSYPFTLARLYQARAKGDDTKNAETIYKNILSVNDKELNTHLALGLLYEKTKQRDQAIAEYQKVLDVLPKEATSAREQVEKMLSNVRSGGSNLVSEQAAQPSVPVAPVVEGQSETPAAPVNP